MKILLLGPPRPELVRFLESNGDEVCEYNERITANSTVLSGVDFIVSYGYRYIIKDDVLSRFPRRAVNLHISYLPWNRGADPNLWSFLEDTPKGVTIHFMDPGIDTGDLIAQREIQWQDDDTLRTTYERLTSTIENLFMEVWPEVRSGKVEPIRQPSGGTSHRMKDKIPFERLLHKGWDTPVCDLIGKANTCEESVVK